MQQTAIYQHPSCICVLAKIYYIIYAGNRAHYVEWFWKILPSF